MKTILKSILIGFICLLTGFLLGGGGFYCYYKNKPSETIYLRDTISIPYEVIKYKTKVKYVTKFDTVVCVVRDSVVDTVQIELPIEHKVYQDTIKTDTTNINIGIEYSGFKPQLDRVWIDYSYTGKQVVKSKKKGKFGQSVVIGVQAGYGIGISNPVKFQPYIGIGVTYGFGYSW